VGPVGTAVWTQMIDDEYLVIKAAYILDNKPKEMKGKVGNYFLIDLFVIQP
jgi:hypothetical protein